MILGRQKLRIHVLGITPIKNRTDVFIRTCRRLEDKVSYTESNKHGSHLYCLVNDLISVIWSDVIYIQAGNNAASKSLPVRLARFLSKKIIAEVYISSYETEVLDRKRTAQESEEARRLMEIDRKLLKSDYTIFMTDAERKKYNRLAGLDGTQSKEYVIPLSTDAREKAKLDYWNGERDVCSIVWWGTYIPLHGLYNIIEGARILRDYTKHFHLYLLGNSDKTSEPYQKKIEEMEAADYITIINDYSIDNGRLVPFILNNCDIALGALGNTDKARTVVPNKVLEAISMRIPLLNRKSEALEEFYPEQSQTVFYCESAPQSIAEKLREIMQTSRNSISERTEHAYELFNIFNNKSEAGVHYYERMLKDVIDDAEKEV